MTEGILSRRNSQMQLRSINQLMSSSLGLFKAFPYAQYSKMEERGMGYFGLILKFILQQLAIIFGRIQMEDRNQVSLESNLSKTSSYLLGLSEVKANTLQQEMLMLFNSKYTGNQIKRLVKTGDYILDTLSSVFKDLQLNRIYAVIKRVSKSFSNISNHLIHSLEKYQLSQNALASSLTQQTTAESVASNDIEILEEAKMKLKIRRMKGICLYNENYKRNIDVEGRNQEAESTKKKKAELQPQQQVDEKQFKRRLFHKLKKQLKQVEQELYCPSPDEMTTFIIFERKFIESFNHLSHAQSLEVITEYLENSKISAVQLLNEQQDMSQNIAKFKTEIESLIKDAKNITKERNQTISDKFQMILSQFLKKRQQLFVATQKKLNVYQKLVEEKENKRVSIGVETNIKQLGTLKGYERKVLQLEQKYKIKDEQKNKAYRTMLEKSDLQLSNLHAEITKLKITNKTLNDDILQAKKQNSKILEKLYEKRSQTKQQKNEGKLEKISQKKNQSKLEIFELEDKNTATAGKEKEKKVSVRHSNLGRTATKQQNEGQQNSILIKSKQKKTVSIKQIQNDSKTNIEIYYQEGQTDSVEKSKNENLKPHVSGHVNEQSLQSKKEIKKVKSTSALFEDKRRQISVNLKPSTLKVIRTQKNEKDHERGQKEVNKSGIKSKKLEKIPIPKQSFHRLSSQIKIISSCDVDKKQNSIIVKERIRTMGKVGGVDTFIQPVQISKKQIPKLEKTIISNSKLSKDNRSNKLGQLTKYRNGKFLKNKYAKRQAKLRFGQAYSISWDNGNVTQFYEQEAIEGSEGQNSEQHYVLRILQKKKQVFKELFAPQQLKAENEAKNTSHFQKGSQSLKLYKQQSNSLYLTAKSKQKNGELNDSDSVLRVKSLFKQSLRDFERLQKSKWQGENFIFKKKLMKHLQAMEWMNRKKQALPFKFHHESLHENTILHERTKLKENEKLKRIKKKRQQFQNLYRKKKLCSEEQILNESKLPGIKVKSIF